ncbi:MAG: antibiotic biosynthesis monooxygenase [Ramlibacter sp.]|nr:antibiotic biosynthesis monooxygenase [Ramlibacter sp.]
MILVTGSAVVRADQLESALALSLEHVRRSRAEPGCLSHAVHVDAENPQRLVFVEEWASMEALKAHFAVPASREFGKALASLCDEVPGIALYDAQLLKR